MPAQLIALTGGPSILLDKPILLLGRNPECDIQIDSRKVSRRHCCIAQIHDYLIVRDLGSTNGTRINGVRVVEGRMKAGDELTIGNHRYEVQMGELPAVSAGSPARAAQKSGARLKEEDLESCEEPVPLSEPLGKLTILPAAPAHPPPDEPESPPPSPSPVIVPDNLQIAPVSDPFPPSAERPSHHP